MATLGRRPGAAPLTSADIPDNSITAAKVTADVATQAELDAAAFDDNKIQTNIALLAFKTAVNGSLAKYNLQDQVIDEYAHVSDISGIDDGPSVYHVLASGVYRGENPTGGLTTPTVTQDADATGPDGDYTWYKWTDTAATGSYSSTVTQDLAWVVVGGGGGSGFGQASIEAGSGGGAGGFRTGTTLSLVASTTYTVTIGAGGSAGTVSANGGTGGLSSITGSIADIVSTGGGGGSKYNTDAGDGGSGGGGGSSGAIGEDVAITPLTAHGEVGTVQGHDGGAGGTSAGGGGGGAGAAGSAISGTTGGVGGVGENNVMGMDDTVSDAFLTTVSAGVDVSGDRYLAGGGGGGGSGGAGTATAGGGAGATGGSGGIGTAGTANTGGGAGGSYAHWSPSYNGAIGGSGIVILRRLTSIISPAPSNLILQSSDTEAEAQPTKADMVMLIEDAGTGVGTVNTHIKGHISRDSGTTFTEGVLVDEGDWGDDKRILAFHDLDISAQPSDQTMCYKITTHSASAEFDTRIHATSIGWR